MLVRMQRLTFCLHSYALACGDSTCRCTLPRRTPPWPSCRTPLVSHRRLPLLGHTAQRPRHAASSFVSSWLGTDVCLFGLCVVCSSVRPSVRAELEQYDGILFGTGTRFGMIPAQLKALFDSTGGIWAKGGFIGKTGGIFFSTGTQGGGQETTALTFLTQLTHHGMIYIPIGYSDPSLFNMDEVHGLETPPHTCTLSRILPTLSCRHRTESWPPCASSASVVVADAGLAPASFANALETHDSHSILTLPLFSSLFL